MIVDFSLLRILMIAKHNYKKVKLGKIIYSTFAYSFKTT